MTVTDAWTHVNQVLTSHVNESVTDEQTNHLFYYLFCCCFSFACAHFVLPSCQTRAFTDTFFTHASTHAHACTCFIAFYWGVCVCVHVCVFVCVRVSIPSPPEAGRKRRRKRLVLPQSADWLLPWRRRGGRIRSRARGGGVVGLL